MNLDLLRQAAEADAEADRLFAEAHEIDEAASVEGRRLGKVQPGETYLSTLASADLRHRASGLRERAERLRTEVAYENAAARAAGARAGELEAAVRKAMQAVTAPAAVAPTVINPAPVAPIVDPVEAMVRRILDA